MIVAVSFAGSSDGPRLIGNFRADRTNQVALGVFVATFEDTLDRSFDRMRQYMAADHAVTLHALQMLAGLGRAAGRPDRAAACARQMRRLVTSARELLAESDAGDEVAAELVRTLALLDRPGPRAGEDDI